jgi:L-iditol 2-dehydrogenase
MRQALALIADGSVDVASMITHRLPLSRTQDGFQLLARAEDSMKVLVEPWQEDPSRVAG